MKEKGETHKRLLREAKRLVRLRSVTTESNGAIARHVGKLLKEAGFRVRYQEKRIEGISFYNVIGVKGRGRRPLFLMTHLDTVPSGPPSLWTETGGHPWNPIVRGDRIYGLGSADTKLDILAKIFASEGIAPSFMKHPLWIVGTFGEERGLLGARAFCEKIRKVGGFSFVSEPSELKFVHGHRGYAVYEVSFPLLPCGKKSPLRCFALESLGKSAHSSVPHKGRNAVRLAFDYLERISERDPALALYSVQGGSSPNQIPAEATLIFGSVLEKLPRHPFIKVKRLRKSKGPFSVPWKTLYEIFRVVDEGIEKRRRPMTSSVGVIGTTRERLYFLIDFRIHSEDRNQEVLHFFRRRMEKCLRRYGIHATFRIERSGPPLSVPAHSAILRLARRVSRRAGIPFRLVKKSSCTEAGFLWEKGIPALVFGPGKSAGNIHAPNEYNEIEQLEKAKRFYEVLIRHYCVGNE